MELFQVLRTASYLLVFSTLSVVEKCCKNLTF